MAVEAEVMMKRMMTWAMKTLLNPGDISPDLREEEPAVVASWNMNLRVTMKAKRKKGTVDVEAVEEAAIEDKIRQGRRASKALVTYPGV